MNFAICGNALIKIFEQMLFLAAKMTHRTVWCFVPITREEESSTIFIFCTSNSARARQVKETLEAAGLLCDTDLGEINISAPPGLKNYD